MLNFIRMKNMLFLFGIIIFISSPLFSQGIKISELIGKWYLVGHKSTILEYTQTKEIIGGKTNYTLKGDTITLFVPNYPSFHYQHRVSISNDTLTYYYDEVNKLEYIRVREKHKTNL